MSEYTCACGADDIGRHALFQVENPKFNQKDKKKQMSDYTCACGADDITGHALVGKM